MVAFAKEVGTKGFKSRQMQGQGHGAGDGFPVVHLDDDPKALDGDWTVYKIPCCS